MSSVVIAGDVSGSVTLQAPSAAGSTVVNLPSTLGNTGASSFATTDASGNLGLGITPNAWGTLKAIQVVNTAWSSDGNVATLTGNTFYNGSGFRYVANGAACYYQINNAGGFNWNIAGTGTAGGIPTFTQAMTLDASGRLLVGATSNTGTNTKFVIGNGNTTTNSVGVVNTADVNTTGLVISNWTGSVTSNKVILNFDSSTRGSFSLGMPGGVNAFYVYDELAAAERMRIDSSGNLGIGLTSSPLTSTTAEGVWLTPADGAVIANNAPVLSLNRVGTGGNDRINIEFYNNGVLRGGVGTVGSADGIYFTSGSTERARIDSSGNFGIGTTSPSSRLVVQQGSGAYQAIQIVSSNPAEDAGLRFQGGGGNAFRLQQPNGSRGLFFYDETAAAERARIDTNGYLLVGYTTSNGAYKLQVNSQIFATSSTIATSDARYKENVVTLDGALDVVKALRPVQFSWKEHPVHAFDTSTPTVGFLAQELQQVLANKPYLNSVVKANECVIEQEEKDEEGNITKPAVTEEFLGIAEGNMIAILTAAIKEQQTLIQQLQADVATLKGNV